MKPKLEQSDEQPTTMPQALLELEAAKTASRRAREEVGDITHLLLQARAENKSLQRALERSRGELRELNSALSHFEETYREELQGNLVPGHRRLTREKLQRALAEEQEAHRSTRRQLELLKLTVAESSKSSANSKEGKRWGLGLGRTNHNKHSPSMDSNDQSFDDAFTLSLEDKREEMERSSNEYRNIILMLSEEIESLKGQLSVMTQAFEDHIQLPSLIELATSDNNTEPKIRAIAAKAIANLAAKKDRRREIVGSLQGLLAVLNRGTEDENNQRLICAAVANLSIDSKYQAQVVNSGGLVALKDLSEKARDSQTLRMVAGALANLCANALLKEELAEKGIVKIMGNLQKRMQHPDIEAQIARGLANLVAGAGELWNQSSIEQFIHEGGLLILLKLAESREADLTVKKHVGKAIHRIIGLNPQLTREQVQQYGNGIKPLLDMKKCADKEVSELAELTLKLYNKQ